MFDVGIHCEFKQCHLQRKGVFLLMGKWVLPVISCKELKWEPAIKT